jgi:DNA-binding response OmpR family regulator
MATILIVDDEQPLREILAELLEAEGHRVVVAGDGRQALARVAEDRPDIVVSDVMMPRLNGVKLCQYLKAEPTTAAIPVILLSAAGPTAALGAGADAFLEKPFDLDEVEALVRALLPPAGHPDPTRALRHE